VDSVAVIGVMLLAMNRKFMHVIRHLAPDSEKISASPPPDVRLWQFKRSATAFLGGFKILDQGDTP
jgi:hypothetical protein